MIRLFKVLAITCFLMVSCTWKKDRVPSSQNNETNFSGFIEVPRYGEEVVAEGKQSQEEFIKSVENKFNNFFDNSNSRSMNVFKVRGVAVDELPNDLEYVIQTGLAEDGRHEIKIFYSKKYETTALSSKELSATISQIYSNRNFNTPLSFFELMFNAKNKDVEAKVSLSKIREMALDSVNRGTLTEEQKAVIEEQVKIHNEVVEQREKEFKAYRRDYRKKEAQRKSLLDIMDKLENDEQFRTLIQKNDRVGTAELIEKYLPREQMTSMEHAYWNLLLTKMKNPIPLKDRVFMYRGTGGDRLYPAIVDGKPLEYEQAVKESKLVTLSTVINRNQGTWNRRLRSLQTMYGKTFSTNPSNEKSEFNTTSRLSLWMKRHSQAPQGSPFLSFTPDLGVAENFADEYKTNSISIGAFAIDPEILLFNQMSGFEGEVEYLQALLTFPDEMVGYYDSKYETDLQGSAEKILKSKMIEKYKAEYGSEGEKIFKSIYEKNKTLMNKDLAYLVPQYKEVKVKTQVEVEIGWFKRLIRRILGKKGPVFKTLVTYEKRSTEIKEKNNCLYLILSFK